MALNIIENISNISSGSIIYKNDLIFNKYKDRIEISSDIKQIIKHIDNADYISGTSIQTRYEEVVDISKLSTGCKTVINVLLFPNKIVNCIEAGSNAIEFMFKYFHTGNIHIPFIPVISSIYATDIDYKTSDGAVIHCENSDRLLEVISNG